VSAGLATYTAWLDLDTRKATMMKFKPHKGLKKRVRLSATGKPRYRKSFAGHLMSHKSGRRCQRLRRKGEITGALAKSVQRALGAG
jgi:large subunit ribosomal protein L35